MGLVDHFPHENLEEMLDWQLKQVGSSLEEMQRIGVKTMDREYDDLFFAPGEEVEFYTNTGKIELYSTELEAKGFDPMPVYTPHEEPPEGFYRLIYGRAPMHTFSRTSNNPNLTDLMDENAVWINPKVAYEYGKGASDTNLISKVHIDPIMGGTGMRGNFVSFVTEVEVGS